MRVLRDITSSRAVVSTIPPDQNKKSFDQDKFLHQMVVGYQDGQHVNVHTGVSGKQGDTTSSAALCLPVHNIEDY